MRFLGKRLSFWRNNLKDWETWNKVNRTNFWCSLRGRIGSWKKWFPTETQRWRQWRTPWWRWKRLMSRQPRIFIERSIKPIPNNTDRASATISQLRLWKLIELMNPTANRRLVSIDCWTITPEHRHQTTFRHTIGRSWRSSVSEAATVTPSLIQEHHLPETTNMEFVIYRKQRLN